MRTTALDITALDITALDITALDITGLLARRLLLVLVATLTLVSVGCHGIYQEEFVEPRYDVRDANILLIQFREDRLWYGDSALGFELHRNLMLRLQECEDSELLTRPTVENSIYECLEDPPPWQEFAEDAGADFIVKGVVHSIGYEEEGMIGMLRGHLNLTVEVYNPESDRVWRQNVDVQYPEDPETGNIEVAFEQNRQRVRAKLFRLAAKRIAALLCGEIRDKH